MRHIVSYISISCITALCLGNAQAQDMGLDTLLLNPVLISAQKVSSVYPVDSIPKIFLQEANSIVDALRSSGSYYVREYGVGNIANISTRGGSAQHTQLYWNGLPINSPSLGLTDLSLLPAIFLGEVKIHEGASSQLSGSGGLSGSILLNSAQGTEKKQLRLHQQVSPALGGIGTDASFQYYQGSWTGRTAIHHQQADNAFKYFERSGPELVQRKRQNAAIDIGGISQDVKYSIDSRSSIEMNAYYIHALREIPANVGQASQESEQEDRIGRAALRYSRITKRWKYNLLIGNSEEWQRYLSPQTSVDSRVRTRSANARAGTEFRLTDQTSIRGQLDFAKHHLILDEEAEHSSQVTGVFLDLEQTLSKSTRMNAGVRLNQVDGLDRPASVSIGVQQAVSKIPGMALKASLSKNHRDPTLNDRYWPTLGDPNLRAEGGYSADLALSIRKAKAFWSVGGFYSQMDDLISWLPGSDGQFTPINVSRTENTGIQAKLNLSLFNGLFLRSSYSFTQSNIERRAGEELQENIYQPRHRSQVRVERVSAHHRLAVSYAYSSEVRVDFLENRNELPPIYLWGLSYRWTPDALSNVSIGLDLKNILNRNFEYVINRPTASRYLEFHLYININEN